MYHRYPKASNIPQFKKTFFTKIHLISAKCINFAVFAIVDNKNRFPTLVLSFKHMCSCTRNQFVYHMKE